jgi:tricorn protease
MIAPRGGFFDAEGHWAVENAGVTPDVDVENWPKDVIAGRDPQLEKAVEVGLQQLKEHPVQRMMTEPPAPTTGMRKRGLAEQSGQ